MLWQNGLRATAAALTLMVCTGCAGSRPIEPFQRAIEDPPHYARSVGRPKHRVGDDWQIVAGRERAAGAKADDIIVCTVAAWKDMQARHAGAKGKSPIAQACDTMLGAPR